MPSYSMLGPSVVWVLERPATLGSLEGGARAKGVGGMKAGRSSAGTSPKPTPLTGSLRIILYVTSVFGMTG
ncbi:MAG: hypothetical protein ACI3ZQ_01110 [Candidatus Cryptobacteroides sp.]